MTPKCFDEVEQVVEGNVYTALRSMRVQVTEISKRDANVWPIVLFDGERRFKAAMCKELDAAGVSGIAVIMKNNLSELMEKGNEMLKVGDAISIPQYLILGEGDDKAMVLYNLSVLHRT